jgi:acyl-CoA synthetase (NDP forming)
VHAGGALRRLLEPRSIAIVGASPRAGHFGNQPFVNLRTFGFTGEVHGVNPSHTEVEGYPCVASVEELPDGVDHAVLVVRAAQAPELVARCGARGIPAVTVVASGFAETGGEEGRALQARLLEAARSAGVRVCGPNTLGMANFRTGAVPFVSGNLPPEVHPGGVAIVSQSGGIGFTLLNRAWSRGVGAGYLVVAGNEVDVTIPELVGHLARAEGVSAVLCYIEAIRDGPGLLEAAAAARHAGVPVVMVKAGRSAAGQRAAATHTGALASSAAVFDGVMGQAGVLLAGGIDEAIGTAALVARFGPPSGDGFGIYGMGGGLSVVLADQFEAAGLRLPQPSEATRRSIGEALPDTTPGNPLDSGGQFLTARGQPVLPGVLKRFAADPAFDALVVGCMPVRGTRERIYSEAIVAAAAAAGKPCAALHYSAPPLTDGLAAELREAGIPVLDPPEAGVRALALWSRLARRSAAPPSGAAPARAAGGQAAGAVEEELRRARAAGAAVVTEYDASRVLAALGVPFAASAVAAGEDEAVRLAAAMEGPVVLKGLSPQVPHRSRAGLVRLGVEGEARVRAAYRAIATRLAAIDGAVFDGVLVQELLPPGRELLVGLERDPQFGPVVVLGLGGTDAEALRRICVRVPPVGGDQIAEMLEELGLADLAGGCGRRLAAVLDGVGSLGALAGDVVESVDVNPLVVGVDGSVRAADALIVLRADA